MDGLKHFEGWMIFLITLFFGISSFCLGMSQIENNKATDIVLESVINYENERIFSDADIKLLIGQNSQYVLQNSLAIASNNACLLAVLGDRMVPFNRTLYDLALESCSLKRQNITFPKIYSQELNPIGDYSEKIKEIGDKRINAIWWQGGSMLSFILALGFFVFLLEKKAIEHYFKRKFGGRK